MLRFSQLPPVLPRIAPAAVTCGIPDCVIRNRRAPVLRQLVLPRAVAVSISDRSQYCPDRSRGIGISLLVENIPAPVIGIHPRRSRAAARRVVRVVHTDQLPQRVIRVLRGQ